jgi:peptide deformylase
MECERRMALREIIKYPDPVLITRSAEVARVDSEVRELVADMVETMHAAPGVGLAANQVGVTLRVAVVDLSVGKDPTQLIVLVNPRVVSTEGSIVEEEGCLSIPGFTEKVERPARVVVEALNFEGALSRLTGEGLLARALLHEIDHLDGILFIEHLSPLKRRLIRKRIQKMIRAGEWAGVTS